MKRYRDQEIERFKKQVQERKELIRKRDHGEISKETYALTRTITINSAIKETRKPPAETGMPRQPPLSLGESKQNKITLLL